MFCQICGGKINSLAQSCPHCSNDDFMSVQNSYIDETIISSLVYPDESFSFIWGDMVPKSLKKSEQNPNEIQNSSNNYESDTDYNNMHTRDSGTSQLSSPAKLSAAKSLQPAGAVVKNADQPNPVMYLVAGAFGMLVVVAVIILLVSVFKKDDNNTTLEETDTSISEMDNSESSVNFGAMTNPYQEINPNEELLSFNDELSQEALLGYSNCTPADEIISYYYTNFSLQDMDGRNADYLRKSLHLTLGITDYYENQYLKVVQWKCESNDVVIDGEPFSLTVSSDSEEKKYSGFSYYGETIFHEVQINESRCLLSIDKNSPVTISIGPQYDEYGNKISVIKYADDMSGNAIDLKEYRQDNMNCRYYKYVSPATENTSLEMTNSTVSAMYLLYETIGSENFMAVMQFGEESRLTLYWLNENKSAYPISVVFFCNAPKPIETEAADNGDYNNSQNNPGHHNFVRPPVSNNPDQVQGTEAFQNPDSENTPDSGNIPDDGQNSNDNGSLSGGVVPETGGEVPNQSVEGY